MPDQGQIWVSLSFSHQPQSRLTKGKMMPGRQKVPLRPLVTKKVASAEEEKNQDTTETRGRCVRELFHFVDRYYQLPGTCH